jgi:hypothetical protein
MSCFLFGHCSCVLSIFHMSAFSLVIVHVCFVLCFVLYFPGATIVVSGDGRYFSKDAVQVI